MVAREVGVRRRSGAGIGIDSLILMPRLPLRQEQKTGWNAACVGFDGTDVEGAERGRVRHLG